MRTLLLSILLPTSTWATNSCLPDSQGICTPDENKKREILQLIFLAQDSEKSAKAALDQWKAALSKSKAEQLAAIEDVKRFDKEETAHYEEAIRLTQEAYHITLPKTDGPIVKPRDPEGRGNWATGMQASWSPEILIGDHKSWHVFGSDKTDHYLAVKKSDIEDANGKKDTYGITQPDGKVLIMKEAFDKALERGNPDILAYAIHHEAPISAS